MSLARLRSFAPTLVYGGHGEAVTDFEELFNRYLQAIRARQKDVIKLVPKEGITAWEMSQQMFPHVKAINQFLAVSEAVANLDLAVADGRLRLESRDNSETYYRL